MKIRHRKRCEFLLPKIFLLFLWRKIPQTPKSGITHMVTRNGGHPLHHHLRNSGRPSNSLFNRRPPSSKVPNLHTVAASLHTVVHPPVALQAIYYHPCRQSTVRFDSLCSGPVQNLHKPKKNRQKMSTL
jgi:hypothetical protein